jgi:hypothetical protein
MMVAGPPKHLQVTMIEIHNCQQCAYLLVCLNNAMTSAEHKHTRSVPKLTRMIFLRSAEGPGKESRGSRQVEGERRYTV